MPRMTRERMQRRAILAMFGTAACIFLIEFLDPNPPQGMLFIKNSYTMIMSAMLGACIVVAALNN